MVVYYLLFAICYLLIFIIITIDIYFYEVTCDGHKTRVGGIVTIIVAVIIKMGALNSPA